jgi:hypothetical protein
VKKIFLSILFILVQLNAATLDIDKENLKVNLKNNAVNLLNFPFLITSAKATTETPESFDITTKNKTVTIVLSADQVDLEWADLLVWSDKGEPYLIKLLANGNEGQIFNFASNENLSSPSLKAARYETGKIESDIKKIMKKIISGEQIPGYTKVDVKKMFKTHD